MAGTFAFAVGVGAQKVSAQATPIQLTVGDTTTLLLDGNPSTGYRWELEPLAADAAQVLSVDVKGYAPAKPAPGERPVLGAPQKFEVFVGGLAPGKATLAFKYVKAGTPTAARRQEFAVEVLDEAQRPPDGDGVPDLSPDPTSDPTPDTPGDMFADPDGN